MNIMNAQTHWPATPHWPLLADRVRAIMSFASATEVRVGSRRLYTGAIVDVILNLAQFLFPAKSIADHMLTGRHKSLN